jgi:thioredoxin 1
MEILDFIKQIDKNLTVVDFWAPWCSPCKHLSPIIDKLAEENPHVKVIKVNVDESGELAANFGIRNIPTVIYFKEEQEVERITGANQKSFYENLIKKHS